MQQADPDSLALFLYTVLTEPFGVAIPTNNPQGLKQLITSIRNKLKDEMLSRFEIYTSPVNPTSELWLILKPEYRQ